MPEKNLQVYSRTDLPVVFVCVFGYQANDDPVRKLRS